MGKLLCEAALSSWKTIENKTPIFNDRPTGLRKLCNELEQELKEDKMIEIVNVLIEIDKTLMEIRDEIRKK